MVDEDYSSVTAGLGLGPINWMWYHFNKYAPQYNGWVFIGPMPLVDYSALTFGLASVDSRRDFSRDQFNRAVRAWRAGDKKEGARRIGMGMHARQDAWAHGDMFPYAHTDDQAPWLQRIDDWTWNPPNGQDRRKGCEDETVAYYLEFAAAVR